MREKKLAAYSIYSSLASLGGNYVLALPLAFEAQSFVSATAIAVGATLGSVVDAPVIVYGNRELISDGNQSKINRLHKILSLKLAFFITFSILLLPVVGYLYQNLIDVAIGMLLGFGSCVLNGPYVAYGGRAKIFYIVGALRVVWGLLLILLGVFVVEQSWLLVCLYFLGSLVLGAWLWGLQVQDFSKLARLLQSLGGRFIISNTMLFGAGRIPFVLFFPAVSFFSIQFGVVGSSDTVAKFDLISKILAGFSGPVTNVIAQSEKISRFLIDKCLIFSAFVLSWFVLVVAVVFIEVQILGWNEYMSYIFSVFPAFIVSVFFGVGLSVRYRSERAIVYSTNCVFIFSVFVMFLVLYFGMHFLSALILVGLFNETLNALVRIYIAIRLKEGR